MRRRGLSLVELVVVLAILAAVSGMVVVWSDGLGGRSRYEETARRLAEIRSAILGPDAVSATGDVLTGGYLQDVGWLPDTAAALLRAPEIAEGTAMPERQYDSRWKTWYGWQGPYLSAPPMRKSDSVAAIYDDWGTDFYGWFAETSALPSWSVPRLSGDYAVRSPGSDGVRDDASGKTGLYERDYPSAAEPLISEAEWVSDLRGLQVLVVNLTTTDYSAAPVRVRFRIIVPRWDHAEDPLGYWPANPDDDPFIGQAFTLDVAAAGDEHGQDQRLYDFDDSSRELWIPHGRRMLFLVRDSDGQPLEGVHAYAELHVSQRLSPPTYVKVFLREIRD